MVNVAMVLVLGITLRTREMRMKLMTLMTSRTLTHASTISSRAQVSRRYELGSTSRFIVLENTLNGRYICSAAFEWLAREGTRIGMIKCNPSYGTLCDLATLGILCPLPKSSPRIRRSFRILHSISTSVIYFTFHLVLSLEAGRVQV